MPSVGSIQIDPDGPIWFPPRRSLDWSSCPGNGAFARAHVRRDDQRTLKSLLRVMHDTGFSDAELAELRVRATMRVEDVPEDFVPDMNIFQVNADVAPSPDIAPQPDTPHDIEDEIVDRVQDEILETIEPAEEDFQNDAPKEMEAEEEDPDAPQQLSLF